MTEFETISLHQGDCIGLAAPAHAVNPEDIEQGRALLERYGYRVKVAANALDQDDDEILNEFAGPDARRVASFNEMLANDEIDGICCLTGGYGVSRILSQIDYDALRNAPKLITGFSDITALHLAVYRETGLASLHSPNIDSLPLIPMTETAWITALQGSPAPIPSSMADLFSEADPLQCWRPGRAEGVLVGGNLTLVAALEGTPHALPRDEDVILFLEDVGEFAYRIDLMLQQLKMAGAFDRIRGVLLGQFSKRRAQKTEPEGLLREVLRAFFETLEIPVMANVPIGHVKKNLTVAHGARVMLDAGAKEMTYLN